MCPMSFSRPALLICAHGSRASGWAERVHEFSAQVADTPGVKDCFVEVRAAFLESSEPTVPDAVNALLKSDCDHVFTVPLLLTMSTHLTEDLPGLLGLPVPERVRQKLIEEGQAPLPPDMPLTLLRMASLDALLTKNVCARIEARDEQQPGDAVLLCAYGSSKHGHKWEALLSAIGEGLLARGYSAVEHAYVGHVVHMSPEPTTSAITRLHERAQTARVHVVPLLLGVTRLQTEVIDAGCRAAKASHPALQLLYTPDAILPDPRLAAEVGHLAQRSAQAP